MRRFPSRRAMVSFNQSSAAPTPPNQTTQMTLGSNLEVLEVATGHRETIYKVPYSIQAPNWTPDGKSLIFNDVKGTLYRFDLASGSPQAIKSGRSPPHSREESTRILCPAIGPPAMG